MQGYVGAIAGVLLAGAALAQDAGEPPVDPSEALYETRTDWSGQASGSLNLSAFLFNDLNENGTWDDGDRVMPAVAVALAKDGVGVKIARANANGFANFPSSTVDENAVIDEPATYTFQVIPPPGWRVTTGNTAQEFEAVLRPGSPVGIGLTDMPHPIGLAREKFIQGAYAGRDAGEITLTRDGKRILGGAISAGDTFTLKVPRGRYVLSDGSVSREVEVGDNPVDIGRLSARDAPDGTEVVADFDDLTDIGLKKVPNGYRGVNWFNLNAMRREYTRGSIGYVNGNTSGSYIAYTSSGHPAEITSDEPFGLVSMQMTASWGAAEGETAIIEYWRGEEKILTDQVRLSVMGPVRYAPRIGGITRVRISAAHFWQIALDDIVLEHPDPAE